MNASGILRQTHSLETETPMTANFGLRAANTITEPNVQCKAFLGLLLLTIQGQTVSWAEGSPSSSRLLPYFPLHGIFPDVSLMFNPIFPDYSILASTSQTPGMTKIVPGATHRNRQRDEDLDWQTHRPC